jgi:hypothetical protein
MRYRIVAKRTARRPMQASRVRAAAACLAMWVADLHPVLPIAATGGH